MKIERYSHNFGDESISPDIINGILEVLTQKSIKMTKGCGNILREQLLSEFKLKGWSDDFILDANSQISLTSSNSGYILCFQTGNTCRFYADILKMQYVYTRDEAKAAIYILPSKAAAKTIGSNIVNFDRLCFELKLFKKIITIPTLVIGIY